MQIINRKSVISVAALASIFIAMAVNGSLSSNKSNGTPPKTLPQYPVVSVTLAKQITHQSSVIAYGEVTSQHQLALTSQVSGQITYLSPKFRSGFRLKKGEVLARIESIGYQQALASAQMSFADAELALAQEKLNSSQAAQEWQQSGLGNEVASDLVLRKPQLVAANASYKLWATAVEKAKYDLAQTELKVPFDALVVSRTVQLGSNVQSGEALAQLYDTALFEVSLPLSAQQWKLLPNRHIQQVAVNLTGSDATQQWTAHTSRIEQHINDASRQRALIAVIKQPLDLDTPLFPGTFVTASMLGQSVDKLWKLPASALINSNTVWQVSDDGVLSHLAVEVVFSQDSDIYVKPLSGIESAKIVNRPLASYLVAMKVEATIEGTS